MSRVDEYLRKRKQPQVPIQFYLGCLLAVLSVVGFVYVSYQGYSKVSNNIREAGESQQANREKVLAKTLSYLSKLEDVAWVTVEDNNVYVGLTRKAPDLELVLRAAALKGNRAINFGCHVWAVPEDAAPGDVSRFYGEATARYGRVQDCFVVGP